MTWTSGDAVDSARHAQLDHTLSGVIGYHPADHGPDEGPLAVTPGSSSSGVEIDINGGSPLIADSRYEIAPTTVSLAPGDNEDPRKDIVYAATDESIQILPGEPQDSTILDANNEEYAPTASQAPIPEPSGNAHRIKGAILAVVWVPPGATRSSDLIPPAGGSTDTYIHDRRRPAPDTDQGRPRQPTISHPYFSLLPGDYRGWPLVPWPGQTFRLWEYTLLREDFGMFGNSGIDVHIIDMADIVDSDPPIGDDNFDISNFAVWTSADERDRSEEGPILEMDISGTTDGYAFVVENTSETFEFSANNNTRLMLQVTHTIEDTDQI